VTDMVLVAYVRLGSSAKSADSTWHLVQRPMRAIRARAADGRTVRGAGRRGCQKTPTSAGRLVVLGVTPLGDLDDAALEARWFPTLPAGVDAHSGDREH
jgi:hypothetical protein